MKKILVTGSSGYIGSHLCRLLEKDYEVYGLDIKPPQIEMNNFHSIDIRKTFDLGNTTYTPDFYLPEFHLYIEIKGFWRDDAKKKFQEFEQKYCGEKIKILNENELTQQGIL